MPETLQKFITRIDELTLRERAIILAGILIVLSLGWYSYLMEPLAKKEQVLVSELDQKHQQLQTLNEQFEAMTQARNRNPNAANRARLAKLQAELAEVTRNVQQSTSSLVAPDAMPDVLRNVLEQSSGLSLISVKGLGTSPLVKPETSAAKSAKGPGRTAPAAGRHEVAGTPSPELPEGDLGNAYKHGLEIEFSGDFFSTLEYMRKLEKLRWGFFWESVDFKVKKYPEAKASIRLYTLSLDSNWIGT